jgi:opacity protein-like surface antigen
VLFCTIAAQAAPKAEVFGGYQFTRTQGGGNWSGWNAALTGNLGSTFGVTADFSQVYNSGVHYTTYTFGPEIHAHLPIVKPFAHVLLGGAKASFSGASTSGFAMYFGGGIDAGHGALAWRVIQFDWLDTRFSGVNSSKNVRASTGVVLRF